MWSGPSANHSLHSAVRARKGSGHAQPFSLLRSATTRTRRRRRPGPSARSLSSRAWEAEEGPGFCLSEFLAVPAPSAGLSFPSRRGTTTTDGGGWGRRPRQRSLLGAQKTLPNPFHVPLRGSVPPLTMSLRVRAAGGCSRWLLSGRAGALWPPWGGAALGPPPGND